MEAAEAGQVLNRSGRPYMPSALRDVCGILEKAAALGTAPRAPLSSGAGVSVAQTETLARRTAQRDIIAEA